MPLSPRPISSRCSHDAIAATLTSSLFTAHVRHPVTLRTLFNSSLWGAIHPWANGAHSVVLRFRAGAMPKTCLRWRFLGLFQFFWTKNWVRGQSLSMPLGGTTELLLSLLVIPALVVYIAGSCAEVIFPTGPFSHRCHLLVLRLWSCFLIYCNLIQVYLSPNTPLYYGFSALPFPTVECKFFAGRNLCFLLAWPKLYLAQCWHSLIAFEQCFPFYVFYVERSLFFSCTLNLKWRL